MSLINEKRKLSVVGLLAVIYLTNISAVHGIDFGFSSIVGNITSGATNAAKASYEAVASIPNIVKPSEASDLTQNSREIMDLVNNSTEDSTTDMISESLQSSSLSPVTEISESSSESSLTSTSASAEKLSSISKIPEILESEGEKAVNTTEGEGGSWIPSAIKKPVDVIAGVPGTVANTVVDGTKDAWKTVSETVVNQDPEHSVKFYLYDDPDNLTSFKQIILGHKDTLESVNVPDGSRLNILIHGFMQDINSSFLQDMKDTLLLHNDGQVICVDWGHMADSKFGPEAARALLYPFIVDNVPTVGEYVGDFIVFLKNNSVVKSLDQVHVLGFSLGAHVSGIAGWTVQNRTDGDKLGRITGLDPAGPKFFLKTKERRLNKDDAKFVDVIHTSHLGYFLQMGHIDFFPNGGKIQPGCVETEGGVTDTVASLGSLLTGSCSHARAWQYYTRSIRDNELYGCECDNLFKYEVTGCEVECEDKIPFGELTPKSARGNFFLTI